MPIQENEVVMLALGIGVFCFGYASRRSLVRIPDWPMLGLAYVGLLVAWTATVLEGFWLPTILNFVEHACYAVSTILVAAWCRRAASGRQRGAAP